VTGNTWKFWIDRGGTFTDVIGCAPNGLLHTLKLLSENAAQYPDAAAEGIRRMLADSDSGRAISEIRMGTTVATNALLERKGAVTALLTTRGFGDAMLIGEQNRPEIFDLHIRKPAPLFAEVAEANERILADGEVREELDTASVENVFRQWRDAGIQSVAICFVHAWRNPVHEKMAAELAHAAGFTEITVSHETSPLRKLISRTSTTVADAYLSPVLMHYVRGFQEALAAHDIACPRILFMQSNGGLVVAEKFRGKDSVLSGPAGGVVGMGATAASAGLSHLIGFDMGGTSTDVSLFAGEPEVADETTIEGIQLRSPMIRIHTVAAGGGSILQYADGRLQAGPQSAGANPGPMSYGRGGPLTVTDANILLGRIQPAWFPNLFGPNADQPLDTETVQSAFDELTAQLNGDGFNYTAEQTAAGFLAVAVDNMANAIRQISVQRGLDPADYTLCCFGGAGGQHACQVADSLGILRILIDPLAPMLSAWGMGAATFRSYRQQTVNRLLDQAALDATESLCEKLETECRQSLEEQGTSKTICRWWLQLRAAGSDTSLAVPASTLENMRQHFLDIHMQRFGFRPPGDELEIEAVRVEAESTTTAAPARSQPGETAERTAATARIYTDDAWHEVPLCERNNLISGEILQGPALIIEANSTTYVAPGWQALLNDAGQLLLECETRAVKHTDSADVDPVQLEIFNNHFMHVAEQMGVVLRNTARSVNIKERLDFSCALFTADGELIANAPHVPVHLGSMDDSVKALLAEHRNDLLAGDCFLANAPYNGGTHLPDITVISPVSDNDELLFIVAARAHHADIGGITPGSMPPHSRHVDEEGIVFDNFRIVRGGEILENDLRSALRDGENPARNPEQNVADIKAQIAANERGRVLLLDMLAQHGRATVTAYTHHVQDNAEESVRNAIGRLRPGSFVYPFDNGQEIHVEVRIDNDAREACIDFTGTSAAADNNFNAPSSVCQAAVLYVFRTLVDHPIPLNAGCRKPLRLVIPDDCMLKPRYPAAVVGGNVETSQCVTDALYGALGVIAASQGTMNNLSFGNNDLQYYETICGGAGAGPGFAGADAVQTHMTNSRMTDVEILETRFPVIVRQFAVRPESGGTGSFRGGNGVIRELEFRANMSAAILSNHRVVAPFGLEGGMQAATGENIIVRSNGKIEAQGSIMIEEMYPGDVLIIKTPGGGGYGAPPATT
jgi:5-oxoprolinase (ATP-hydrolysing)